jgi:hypothetical protein
VVVAAEVRETVVVVQEVVREVMVTGRLVLVVLVVQ